VSKITGTRDVKKGTGSEKGAYGVKSATIERFTVVRSSEPEQPNSDYSPEEIEWMNAIARSAARGLVAHE
jgi:hypothetical protein